MENQKPLLHGILGACLGSLIGAAAYILLNLVDQMVASSAGLYAAISSMVFAYCTLRFYRKFGGESGTIGLLICSCSMLVFAFLGYCLDWVLSYVSMGVPFATSVAFVFTVALTAWEFWRGLLLLLAFIAACTWSLIFSSRKLNRQD